MQALCLALLLASSTPAEDSLPLQLVGEVPTGAELEEVNTRVREFHGAMVEWIGDEDFPAGSVDLTVRFDPQCPTSFASMEGGWNRDASSFQGVIRLPPLRKFDGSSVSVWNVPKDRDYFFRLLLHELCPVYLGRLAKTRGTSFYDRPAWIVQGSEEYFSHHAAPRPGAGDPARAILDRTSLADLSYGIVLDDVYLDGYLLFRFVDEEYGPTATRALLTMPRASTPSLLRQATRDAPEEFQAKLARFVEALREA